MIFFFLSKTQAPQYLFGSSYRCPAQDGEFAGRWGRQYRLPPHPPHFPGMQFLLLSTFESTHCFSEDLTVLDNQSRVVWEGKEGRQLYRDYKDKRAGTEAREQRTGFDCEGEIQRSVGVLCL